MKYKLRTWVLSDAEDLANALNNPNVQANLRDGIPLPYTKADGEFYIQGVLDAPKDSQYHWTIEVEGKANGSIGVFRQDNIHRRTGELGYYLAEPYWGMGIMSRVVREACDWLFESTDLLRIFAEPFASNAGSCRVLEKAGFHYEGTLRQNAVKAGRIIDMKMYSRVRT